MGSSSQFLAATWCPSHRRPSSMNTSSSCGDLLLALVLPAPNWSSAKTFLKVMAFFRIFSSLQHQPFPVSLHCGPLPVSLKHGSLSLSLCSPIICPSVSSDDYRVSACQPCQPWAKGKYVFLTFSATAVTSWTILLPPYPLQNKRALQSQKAFPKAHPLLNLFIHRGADWRNLGQFGRTELEKAEFFLQIFLRGLL